MSFNVNQDRRALYDRWRNPGHLVTAYEKYKSKGFEILGVSLDYPGWKSKWLAAVKKDGLTWTQVSDLNGWSNEVAKLYNISAVPSNFLINPEGVIVAVNLRGDELHKMLEEILEKK